MNVGWGEQGGEHASPRVEGVGGEERQDHQQEQDLGEHQEDRSELWTHRINI